MQLEAKTPSTVNAVPSYGINAAMPECDGQCWQCPHGRVNEVQAQAGHIRGICTAGKLNLQTVASNNLYTVRLGDERGEAAAFAKANGNRDPTASDGQIWIQTVRAQAPSFGILAGRRALEMNSGQHERRKRMDWRTANAKDLQLLNLNSLAPLDPTPVAVDGDLVALLEVHNTRLASAVERVRQLAADRERLVDFDVWQEVDSTTLTAAQAHVDHESWDVVLELHRLLKDCETLLLEMRKRLRERYVQRNDEHTEVVASAEKRLVKQRRALEQANYATAGGYFNDLVNQDEAVCEATANLVSAHEALESAASTWRTVIADRSAILRRQREVFAEMAT
jgi:hypothetical protein